MPFDPTTLLSGPQHVSPPEPHGVTVMLPYKDHEGIYGEAYGIITKDMHYTRGNGVYVLWVTGNSTTTSPYEVGYAYKLHDLPVDAEFFYRPEDPTRNMREHGWDVKQHPGEDYG